MMSYYSDNELAQIIKLSVAHDLYKICSVFDQTERNSEKSFPVSGRNMQHN
jgi:hypothetical protein